MVAIKMCQENILIKKGGRDKASPFFILTRAVGSFIHNADGQSRL